MEFTMVSTHKCASSLFNVTESMFKTIDSLLSIPETFLVYTSTTDEAEFIRGIVNISFVCDVAEQLKANGYVSVSGTILFRHPVSMRTAVMPIYSQLIKLDDKVICLHKIHDIVWQSNDDLYNFLAITECKVRLNLLQFRKITRNDTIYIAVPIHQLTLSDEVKNGLTFMKCESGVNVAYPENPDEGSITKRSILFPHSLICTTPIEHNGMCNIVSMKPHPMMIYASDIFCKRLNISWEKEENFLDFIKNLHTVEEYERLQGEIMLLYDMSPDDVKKLDVEFITSHGREKWSTTIYKCRTCIVASFESK